MTERRYPLAWPTGWPRTATVERKRASFGRQAVRSYGTGSWKVKEALSITQALNRLDGELSRLGVTDWLVSSNLRVRLDGLPYSNQAEPADPGIAVYFTLEREDRVLACDRWTRPADNIAAIAAHIECLRGIDRYGVGSLAQAFAGYAALPPAAADWRSVFALSGTPPWEAVEVRYRELAREHHPDRGGDPAVMAKLNAARDAARLEIGGN